MDEIEAHYLVKRELETFPLRLIYAATAGVPLDETKWIGKWWFWDEQD